MAETVDPRAALNDKDVSVRAAALRDLGRDGGWDDLELLIGLATKEKSPSVRLLAAGAAAEVVGRARLQGLSGARHDEVVERMRLLDPQGNPSLLMIWAALASPLARSRLGRLLRDPHSDVRLASVAALRRMAMESDDLEGEVMAWLDDRRTPPDAALELARLAADAGWTGAVPRIRAMAGRVRAPDGALADMLRTFTLREELSGWQGLWTGDAGWRLVDPAGLFDASGRLGDVRVEAGVLHTPEGPARLWMVPMGREVPAEARLRLPGGWFTRREGKDLAKAVEDDFDAIARHPVVCDALLAALEGVDGAVAPRVRPLLRWRAGDADAAAVEVDQLLEKKGRPELHWWRANIALSQGDLDLAREQVQAYLAAASKKSPHLEEAEGLRARLG